MADRARARGESLGPLHGLPITIKDCIDTAGLPTTGGVPARAHATAFEDAPVSRRAFAAGAVLLGKTNTSTMAGDWQADNALFGRTNNPWDLSRTPGGSTGGGAAALATGLTALEIGTDIGGSIRVPAAFCGLYGHRPSETIVPRYGYVPHLPLYNPAMVLNAIGPLARNAADLELALTVLAGPPEGEDVAWRLALPAARHQRLAEFRVAVLPWLDWLPVDDEIRAAQENLVTRLRALGVEVAEATPEGFDLWAQETLYAALLGAVESSLLSEEERRSLAKQVRRSDNPFGVAAADGLVATVSRYFQMLYQRERSRAAYRAFFRSWDILLAPVAFTVAFPHIPEAIPLSARTLPVNGVPVPYERLTADHLLRRGHSARPLSHSLSLWAYAGRPADRPAGDRSVSRGLHAHPLRIAAGAGVRRLWAPTGLRRLRENGVSLSIMPYCQPIRGGVFVLGWVPSSAGHSCRGGYEPQSLKGPPLDGLHGGYTTFASGIISLTWSP